MNMVSVVSGDNKIITHVALKISVGSQRFLEVRLPGEKDSLWTVLVNKKEVSTSRDKDVYRVPIEEHKGNHPTDVELIYAGTAPSGGFVGARKYKAPKFGLPLNNVTWDFFVPAGLKYYGFDGTMEREKKRAASVMQVFNSRVYQRENREENVKNEKLAKEWLKKGEKYKQVGELDNAQKAYQSAMNYSLGQRDLNEDARVLSRSLKQQQGKIGLVVRRDQVRFSRNKLAAQQLAQIEGFQDGQYTQDYAKRVERNLSEKENMALDMLVSKVLDQQAAAAGVLTSINITMPKHGTMLRFKRKTLVKPEEVELTVEFKASAGRGGRLVRVVGPGLLFFLGFFWLSVVGVKKKD